MVEPCVLLRVVRSAPSRWTLVGELDIAGVPELEAQLAGWDGDVVLDCSGLTFVDASALSLFVRIRNTCEARGVEFALVKPSRGLLRLLALTGLDGLCVNGSGR